MNLPKIKKNSRTACPQLMIKVLKRIKICRMKRGRRKRNLNNLINLRNTRKCKRETIKKTQTNKMVPSRFPSRRKMKRIFKMTVLRIKSHLKSQEQKSSNAQSVEEVKNLLSLLPGFQGHREAEKLIKMKNPLMKMLNLSSSSKRRTKEALEEPQEDRWGRKLKTRT